MRFRTGGLSLPGASAGIGEACAWRFAQEGCKLILTARRFERLKDLKDALVDQYKVSLAGPPKLSPCSAPRGAICARSLLALGV